MKRFLSSKIFHLIFLAVLVAGIYANSLGGDFVFDDKPMILTYDLVKDASNIPKAFISPTSLYGNTNYYRPIQTVTNITDYFLWGRAAFGFHVTNIFFHMVAVLLLYWLMAVLYGRKTLAFLTAALFAVHPVNTSVVSYIAGRADSILLCFMLLSFIFYIKAVYRASGRICFSFSVFFYVMCLLTKEFALIIPAVYFLFDMYLSGYTPLGKRGLKPLRYLPFIVLVVLYLVFRFTKMSFFVEGAIEPFPFSQRLVTVPYWVGQYLRMIVLPNDLHFGRIPWVAWSIVDPKVVTSFLAVASITAALFTLRKRLNAAWFGLCWFYIMLLPALNIVTPLFYTLAENWLYIASIGIYAAIASLGMAAYSGISGGERRGLVKYTVVVVSGFYYGTGLHDSKTEQCVEG